MPERAASLCVEMLSRVNSGPSGTRIAEHDQHQVKVRITHTPREHELDGVRLDVLKTGMVRDLSPSLGSWLVMQGYAEPEMRSATRLAEQAVDIVIARSLDPESDV
jgi:hypothetical protein